MAFFDDRKFLLSHIRHSFITCDDSGICEMAMLNEIMPHHSLDETDTEFLDGIVSEALSHHVLLVRIPDPGTGDVSRIPVHM